MAIGIILAKAKSSRLPNKNFRNFCGKPMIAWTIETALKSKVFDKIVVTTDENKNIKKYSKYNVESLIRPKELSKEKYGIDEVMKYTLKKLNIISEYACCLFPSAPLMHYNDLKNGLKKIKQNKYDYIFAASDFSHPVERSFKILKSTIKMSYSAKYMQVSSKFLSKSYYDTGYFYWAKSSTWKKNYFKYNSKSSIIKIPNWRAQDIDTLDDLIKTKLIFKSLNINLRN